MRIAITATVVMSLLLTGCGGGGSGSTPQPTPPTVYGLGLSIAQTSYHSNGAPLPYNSDALATVSITGGSPQDADYPEQIGLVSSDPMTIIKDPNHCFSNTTHQASCQFMIHNIDSGPHAGAADQDTIQLQATSKGEAIASNAVLLLLEGHPIDCSGTSCLDLETPNDVSTQPSFNKAGMFHTGVEYQFKLSLGNPAKIDAPTDAGLFNPRITLPANTHLMLMDASCDEFKPECTFTLQNQNTDAPSDVETITASASVSGQLGVANPKPYLSTPVTHTLSLTVPLVQGCRVDSDQPGPDDGISLANGQLSVYQQGAPLNTYTSTDQANLYPVAMTMADQTSFPIHYHVAALTSMGQPHLFTNQANEHIPKSGNALDDPGFLSEQNCAAALDSCQKFFNTSDVKCLVTPMSEQSLPNQQCLDNSQTRLVYYAIPKGAPPSKNGWPVVIALNGVDGQTTTGYYLTGADSVSGVPLTGSSLANVFNNAWNWADWETNFFPPKPTSTDPDGYSYSYYVRMRLIETWLSRGFAVIIPSTWNAGRYDGWSFEPSYTKPWPYIQATWPLPPAVTVGSEQKPQDPNSIITYLNMAYWPGFDQQFLQTLMAFVADPFAFDSHAGDIQFDMHNVFLMGYSAGGNMVSRLIQEFPTMQYTDTQGQSQPFPKIKGAIILSGGSYGCYLGGDGNTCPVGLEESYNDAVSVQKHPPTLLAQSLNDDNAGDPGSPAKTGLAGSVYYQSYLALCPVGSNCQPQNGGSNGGTGSIYQGDNLIQMIHTNNPHVFHYYFPEMVIPSLNLMLKNTCVAKGALFNHHH